MLGTIDSSRALVQLVLPLGTSRSEEEAQHFMLCHSIGPLCSQREAMNVSSKKANDCTSAAIIFGHSTVIDVAEMSGDDHGMSIAVALVCYCGLFVVTTFNLHNFCMQIVCFKLQGIRKKGNKNKSLQASFMQLHPVQHDSHIAFHRVISIVFASLVCEAIPFLLIVQLLVLLDRHIGARHFISRHEQHALGPWRSTAVIMPSGIARER